MSLGKVKIFFPNLDAIRTIAFLFVFSEHVLWGAIKKIQLEGEFLNHFVYNLFSNGALGVSIFFVLSGFLITYLILNEIELNGKLDVVSFYKRRFLRIWPLYLLLLVFIFFVYPLLVNYFNLFYFENPANKWMYFAFLSNFDMIRLFNESKESFMQTGVTWSVAIEEQFYLIWPLIFLIINKRLTPVVFIFIILFSIVFRYYHCENPTYIYFHTFGVFGDLALGGFLAWMALYFPNQLSRLLPQNYYLKVLIYLFGIFFVLSNDYFISKPEWRSVNRFLSTLFFVYVLADQNFTESVKFKFSNLKFLSYLGKWTYGMYLLHPIAFLLMQYVYALFNISEEPFLNRLFFAIFTMGFTILISFISFRYFESPFLKLKNKFAYISKE
jgi:peptidoglycan/LPS O-acetylase OafA/YrhL